MEALRAYGFSPEIIERFFRPFLGGIFLDPELATSSRMFRFVFRMFALGHAALPAEGMQAIPQQLASALPEGSVRLTRRSRALQANRYGSKAEKRYGHAGSLSPATRCMRNGCCRPPMRACGPPCAASTACTSQPIKRPLQNLFWC